MAEPHVVSALRDKRAEVSGIIADLERRVAQHRADLVHIDAVLRMYAPEVEPEGIRAKPVRMRNDWFRPGELSRIVLDILRVAPAPLTVREIAGQVMERRGMDAGDERTANLMRKLVNNVLTRKAADLVERADGEGRTAWRVAG